MILSLKIQNWWITFHNQASVTTTLFQLEKTTERFCFLVTMKRIIEKVVCEFSKELLKVCYGRTF